MEFKTPWWAKLLVGVFVIASTIVGSIWTGFETLDGRMDAKVKEGKAEVLSIVSGLRTERDQLMKAQEDKVAVQIAAVHSEMVEVRKDVRALLGIARSRTSQVFVERENSFYTTNRNKNSREEPAL